MEDHGNRRAQEFRLRAILEGYLSLLASVRGTPLESQVPGSDAVAEAFRVADLAAARGVQQALNASGARAQLPDAELSDLARREQDAQQGIAAVYGSLARELTRPVGERSEERVEELRVLLDQLRDARAALMEEIEARFPTYAELVNPKLPDLNEVQSLLRPHEVLISTYVAEDKTYVWVIPPTGKEVRFTASDLSKETLTEQVGLLRGALDPNARVLGDIPEFDVGIAHGLYQALLEPGKSAWQDAEELVIVAHGPLGYLPLSVLVTESTTLSEAKPPLFSEYRDVPWLARDYAVSYLPSVTALRALRSGTPRQVATKPFTGFGNPIFSERGDAESTTDTLDSRGTIRQRTVALRAPIRTREIDSADLEQLSPLPETEDELAAIASALNADPASSVFVGSEATETKVKGMDLSNTRVLAFATHGLIPGDLDGLNEPALAFSAPGVVGDEKEDGLLTLSEVLGLQLNADWVVLSACNTASAAGEGAEAVSGLGRAFFYAGTRALLVSNWPVETHSAKALTTDIFEQQSNDPDLSRVRALNSAMTTLIEGPGFVDTDTSQTLYSYAHPIFWAPFTLIGEGD